jgi:hypothetical protein
MELGLCGIEMGKPDPQAPMSDAPVGPHGEQGEQGEQGDEQGDEQDAMDVGGYKGRVKKVFPSLHA